MKKFNWPVIDDVFVFLGLLVFFGGIDAYFEYHDGSFMDNFTVYKENIPLQVEVKAETDNDAFHFHRYRHEIVGMVKKTMSEFSCEDVINNPQKIEEIVKSRFHEPKATLSFLTITVTPPAEFIDAGKALKTASLTVQKDSLISASAKKDAVGYTPEAERLEERRDRRFNAQEERKIKMREIESNEKIKMRQAEALENAADNMGMFGDLAVELH